MNATLRHRPLIALAALMAVALVVSGIAAVIDGRTLTGMNIWFKPIKFEISIGIYAITLSWLIGQLTRMRRLAWVAGTVSAVGLVIEMVIIVGYAAVGETSHFNVSTPMHTAMWSVMAASIVVVWIMTLIVAVALFRTPLGDRARTIAIRAGVIIAIIGMGLAFLMTGPTAQQLDDFQGIAGAHAVGVEDGGAGLPILGWSTVAGDLRIPHFIGMHALQLLPLAAIGLELFARRWPRLLNAEVRRQVIWLAVAVYALALVLLTWQALIGQSIVQPGGAVLVSGLALAGAAVAAALLIAVNAVRRRNAERLGEPAEAESPVLDVVR